MLRTDLEWIEQRNASGWIVRDPLSESFYYLSAAEYIAAKSLDKKMNPADLAILLRDRFSISNPMEWLRVLVIKLHRAHLAKPRLDSQINSPGELNKPTHHWLTRTLLNPFSIKIPAFRPREKMPWAKALSGIFFTKPSVMAFLTLWLALLVLVVQSWIRDPQAMIQSIRILQAGGWFWILLTFGCMKSFHELGHFLACHYFGARCKEVGIMLLFFTPCLYCNVTDSWKLPSKWQRIAISLAGIYFELIISILAALCWLNLSTGFGKSLAGLILIACTLNTIIVNGNPLLRYDGYYVLSDLWEVPNLSSQSSTALWDYWIWFLGGRGISVGNYYTSKTHWLAAYGLLASVYRFSVSVTILWFGWFLLKPFGLGFLVITAATALGIGLAYQTKQLITWMLLEFFTAKPIRAARLLIAVGLFLGLIIGGFLLPLPDLSLQRGFFVHRQSQTLYAPENSWIRQFPRSHEEIPIGHAVLELDSPEVKLQHLELQHKIDELKFALELFRKIAANDKNLAQEILLKESQLKELESQASIVQQRDQAMQMIATQPGCFIANTSGQIMSLTSPIHRFQDSNQTTEARIGKPIQRGDILGWYVTHEDALLVEAYVPEELTQRLHVGSIAACKPDCDPDETYYAKVDSINPVATFDLPEPLRGDSWILGLQDPSGQWKPIQPLCRVTLNLDCSLSGSIRGNLATIHFHTPPRSIASRIQEYLWKNFRWNLN
ncbi:MAG: site-2 protease family protein [Planctomycetota bacterium]|jgi:putative peptide zinc metalloprotease protein